MTVHASTTVVLRRASIGTVVNLVERTDLVSYGRSMTTSRLGLVALALAGLIDPFQLLVLGTKDDAPLAVVLGTAALGIVTLVGVALAWRGSRTGLLVAIGARLLDSALGLPAWFLDAPPFILTLVTTMLALTLVGIALTIGGRRRVPAS